MAGALRTVKLSACRHSDRCGLGRRDSYWPPDHAHVRQGRTVCFSAMSEYSCILLY